MGATKLCVILIVATCIYLVNAAALPEKQEVEVQSRDVKPKTAIVRRAGVGTVRKNTKKQTKRTAKKGKKVKTPVRKNDLPKTTKRVKPTVPTKKGDRELISKKHETVKKPSPKNIGNIALNEPKIEKQPPVSKVASPTLSNSGNVDQVISVDREFDQEGQLNKNFDFMLPSKINKILPPDMNIMGFPEVNQNAPLDFGRKRPPDMDKMLLPLDINQMAPSASDDFPIDDVLPSILEPTMSIQIK